MKTRLLALLSVIRSADSIVLQLLSVEASALAGSALGLHEPMLFGFSPRTSVVLLGSLLLCNALLGSRQPRFRDAPSRIVAHLVVLIPLTAAISWITSVRSDPYFTREALVEVSALMLVTALVSRALERLAATREMPAAVLARSAELSAASALLLFWACTAAGALYASALFLLLSGALLGIALLLRLPGALVPMERVRGRRKDES